MPVTIEIPAQCDIIIGFNSDDPEDAADAQRIIQRRQQRRHGVPTALVEHVMKKTKAGRTFVKPLAEAMTPDTAYDADELSALLGADWFPRKIASKLSVLGRPEKRFRAQIFQRVGDGKYSITPEMKAAIEAA